MSMNIYAGHGTKVVFANPDAGYQHDQDTAAKHLTVGETYTVDHTDIHSWHTNVFLVEVPKVLFNSVMFNDVE